VQPCRVIPREHLLVWTRAPLQWRNVVVKKRVHHVVGNEVEVQRFWILSTTASKLVVLAGEVQMGRASGAPVGSAYYLGSSFSENLTKHQFTLHSSQSL
jgi:hypothetical protein